MNCKKMNSNTANGFVGVFERDNKTCVIAKFRQVQKGTATDLLQQDAIILRTLQDTVYLDDESRKSFITMYSKETEPFFVSFEPKNFVMKDGKFDDSLFNSALQDEYRMDCLMFYGVRDGVSMWARLRETSSSMIAFSKLMHKFEQLLQDCISFSEQTGFSHGDFHAGNIMWDHSRNRLVLIDYGRAYIRPEFVSPAVLSWPELLKSLDEYTSESEEYQPFELNKTTYHMLSPFTRIPIEPHNSNNKRSRLKNRFMMQMDIAGLCVWLLHNYGINLLKIYPNCVGVLNTTAVDKSPQDIKRFELDRERMEAMKREAHLSYFELGVLVFCEMLLLFYQEVNKFKNLPYERVITFTNAELIEKAILYEKTVQITQYAACWVYKRVYAKKS